MVPVTKYRRNETGRGGSAAIASWNIGSAAATFSSAGCAPAAGSREADGKDLDWTSAGCSFSRWICPSEVTRLVGQAEVRQLFKASKIGTIAGSFVTEGKVVRGAKVRVVREGTVIYDTTIGSLRRFNDDAKEVAAGFECGIVLANFQDLKEGDVLEVYETRQVERTLS